MSQEWAEKKTEMRRQPKVEQRELMKRNNKKGKQDATAFLFGAKGEDGVDGGGFANKQAGTKATDRSD